MKKYLALLLAVLMLAAVFTGCASKETTTDTPAAPTDTAEPAKTDEKHRRRRDTRRGTRFRGRQGLQHLRLERRVQGLL